MRMHRKLPSEPRKAPAHLLVQLLLSLGLSLALGACGGADSAPAASSAAEVAVAQVLSVDEAVSVAQSGVLLLDVRSAQEWAQGHLAHALHLPVGEVADHASMLPADKDQPILVYCGSGARASKASETLLALGYRKVSVLRPGGFSELQAAGLAAE
jgi:phage shock protein E